MLGRDGFPFHRYARAHFPFEKRRLCQVHQVVVAPVELQQLGITSMLDLADSFSDEREVRSAMGAADQN